ncbi:related to ATP11 - F1F0-ATPase complex assembly protein [Ustilago trichophora]|uniref:Related to ATP11 - F1F0-ATPase complex assembly protein n=1 Tax=Ustilago trichophora TaxID=86804 RepID=A0A5C3ECY8_9BASI|nr:related to ATP11 - F1F0-ATPase complex assembly protein [Ustilago trichophora]
MFSFTSLHHSVTKGKMRSLGNTLRSTCASIASGSHTCAIHHARPRLAQVSPPLPLSWSHLKSDDQSRAFSESEATATSSIVQDHRASVQLKRDRKLREYEAKIKVKAMQKGLSPEEFKRRSLESAAVKPPQSATTNTATNETVMVKTGSLSEVEKRDLALAEAMKQRSKAEAAKKLASGQVHSTPTGAQEGPIKPLSKILDVERLMTQDKETITKLWAGYHTIKNKLSAVIPTEKYLEMLANARKYPQFVLPLPRQVIDEESDAAGSSKEAFEMQFLEWAVVPNTAGEGLPPSATTLFTPLAEYKLKQDFSQPVLILTFYTDLCQSNGLVLMRGEVTGLNEKTGKGGRIDQAQAQLLALTLQRFYLPSSSSDTPSQSESSDQSACAKLLHDFHQQPENFDVEELVNVAFRL